MSIPTVRVAGAPGLGKWNRKKRTASKPIPKQAKAKPIISKDERREKYTAIARERQIRAKSKNLMCYNCRESGHSIMHCPQALRKDGDGAPLTTTKKKVVRSRTTAASHAICYKCGSTEHTLASCPKRKVISSDPNGCLDLDLPYATCFVCKAEGHLASGCPSNANGIYINGGECKHCGSKQHRGTQCPEKKVTQRAVRESGRVVEQDFSDLLHDENQSKPTAVQHSTHKSKEDVSNKTRRVVNF